MSDSKTQGEMRATSIKSMSDRKRDTLLSLHNILGYEVEGMEGFESLHDALCVAMSDIEGVDGTHCPDPECTGSYGPWIVDRRGKGRGCSDCESDEFIYNEAYFNEHIKLNK